MGRACLCATTADASDVWCGGLVYRPYLIFTLVIFLGAAGYYARESVAGLSTEVIADFSLTRSQYGFVSTIVAIPTVFFAFGFGSLLDAFGVRRCTIVYSCVLVAGSLMVALSTVHTSVPLLNIGRLFVGLGEHIIGLCLCARILLATVGVAMKFELVGVLCAVPFACIFALQILFSPGFLHCNRCILTAYSAEAVHEGNFPQSTAVCNGNGDRQQRPPFRWLFRAVAQPAHRQPRRHLQSRTVDSYWRHGVRAAGECGLVEA